jgi:hypothetical protein
MGLLGKLFGGGKKTATSTAETISVECPHAVLVPRWENVQDMGIADKATRYMCESCKQMFSPQEAEELRQTLAERVVVPTAESDGTGA